MNLSFSNNPKANATSAKLQQLSDDVNRIAVTLARLAVAPGPAVAPGSEVRKPDEMPAYSRQAPIVSVEAVRQAIKARRMRAQFFDRELFADPAWEMLLDLFESELAQLRVSVSSLCVAADVPATTALRWIDKMTDAGLFRRRRDPHDKRRFFIELSPEASEAMRRYFGELN